MEQIVLRYWNDELHIGMDDWRTVYLFQRIPVQLVPEVYKGNLVYRLPQSSKRFSYLAIKKGLKRKRRIVEIVYPF